ncbi:hypothetical protein NRB56_59660 [Nocardia sp. RB56]|uniref:N-acetyltransferase domain-containing protein n=1 Tax=Nocardia aurantia TaxID=2585199 RepID=A0A7K0DZT4_9NOCA|nr:hypothetical protein [Nocardia aurantia]
MVPCPRVDGIRLRRARYDDGGELGRIEFATWSTTVSPAPRPGPDDGFFDGRRHPDDVLVAETDHRVVGYSILQQEFSVPSHHHVLQLTGLAVSPAYQRSGIGRQLVHGAVRDAGLAGARKVTLRVLASNTAAQILYRATGFVVEGVLRAEFLLDGRYVDDVLMARAPTPPAIERAG